MLNKIRATLAQAARASAARAAAGLFGAEVLEFDRESGSLKLAHAGIKTLALPAMSMVFLVKNRSMLDSLKPGDKIWVKAIDDGDKFTVIEIRPLP